MRSKYLFSTVVLGLLLLYGCTRVPSESSQSISPVALPNDIPRQVAVTDDPEDPVSLEAFSKKEFQGSGFTIGRKLAEYEQYTRYYITYRSGDFTISGIMNVPQGRGPFPVLFLNHGYIDPKVYTNGRGLKREQDYLARRGYVVVHSDYRNHADSDDDLDTEFNFRLGYAEDVINAIIALRAADLPYVDGERIGMLGHSMGGGVTLNILTTRPDLVDAAVLFAPVSADVRDNFERWTKTRPEVVERIVSRYGWPQDNPVFWDGISPLSRLGSITAPIITHHGTADGDVPIAWSERFQGALEAAGKESTLYKYEGQPHEFTSDWPLVMRRTVDFFDTYLN